MAERAGSNLKPKPNRMVLWFCLATISGAVVWWGLSLLASPWLAALLAISLTATTAGVAAKSYLDKSALALQQVAEALEHVNSEATASRPPAPTNAATKRLVAQVYTLATSSQDVTNTIQQDRLLLKSILDLLPVAVYIFDKEQKLVMSNSVGNLKLGAKADELINLPREQVLDWQFRTDQSYDIWLEQVRGKTLRDVKFWERVSLLSKDNQRLVGDVAVHYEKGHSHNLETAVVFVDRTEEYTGDEAELDFVAVAAHELRGPITVIRGYLDVFNQELKDVFNVEQRALLQKMSVSAEMLSLYVNNILNVARFDQKNMQLHIRETNWREVLKEVYADLFLRAQVHGRILKLELPDALPTVAVDRVSIAEVINNLVDNAIKYSNEGDEIMLRCEEHEGLVSTTIEDHGIGIPDSVIGHLFKKFYRSHRTKRGVSGTGLGLYLSKAIMDGHGGNIWVRSQVNKGSTFGFDLPTYDSVADTLKKGDNDADSIKHSHRGWIKNHAMYKEVGHGPENTDN